MADLVRCTGCGQEMKPRKCGKCQRCVFAPHRPEKKYDLTPDREAALRRAYQAPGRAALSPLLTELARQWGWPRYAVNKAATRLGLLVTRARRWSDEDHNLLRELAGDVPTRRLAGFLGRRQGAIRQKMAQLGISLQLQNGYSRNEFRKLMNVRHERVETWIRRGWLKIDQYQRITEKSIRRFLWEHMEEYRFAACDEHWLKTELKLGASTAVQLRKKPQGEVERQVAA